MRKGIEILEEIGAATKAIEKHATVMCSGSTFEEGVIAALLWVTNHPQQTSLMVSYLEEYEHDLKPHIKESAE
ncbi:MAG: hypothetical protein HRT38_09540 [Alteromonadaceae bacterium]|nr:hypothetical protein [Alteromonadaceae bacterium]